jgi:hypothetical protein
LTVARRTDFESQAETTDGRAAGEPAHADAVVGDSSGAERRDALDRAERLVDRDVIAAFESVRVMTVDDAVGRVTASSLASVFGRVAAP